MYLSNMVRARRLILSGMAFLALALFAMPASAQHPPRMLQSWTSRGLGPKSQPAAPSVAAAPRTLPRVVSPAAPTTLEVAVAIPESSPPMMVAIRGPDGVVRSYPIEGGTAAIQTRRVTVRAGESITITVQAPQQ